MSKSYGKRYKLTGSSDKKDKKLAHKKQRAMERTVLSKVDLETELDDLEFAIKREISDVYGYCSDGGSLYISPHEIRKWFSQNQADFEKGLLKK